MQLIIDKYESGLSEDPKWQVRCYDVGVTTSLVGRIGEMICDVTTSLENESLVGVLLDSLESDEISILPRDGI